LLSLWHGKNQLNLDFPTANKVKQGSIVFLVHHGKYTRYAFFAMLSTMSAASNASPPPEYYEDEVMAVKLRLRSSNADEIRRIEVKAEKAASLDGMKKKIGKTLKLPKEELKGRRYADYNI
jgi:hypothetical protein